MKRTEWEREEMRTDPDKGEYVFSITQVKVVRDRDTGKATTIIHGETGHWISECSLGKDIGLAKVPEAHITVRYPGVPADEHAPNKGLMLYVSEEE